MKNIGLKKILAALSILGFLTINSCLAQPGAPKKFTHQDTLRGSLNAERTWWNVLKYELTVEPDYDTKTIKGTNKITYFDNGGYTLQLDLQEPMILDSVTGENESYKFRREGNAFHVFIRDSARKYKIKPGPRTIEAFFHGKPTEARRPPWDGGWIWAKDEKGRPWMSVACQGAGASIWYPCKDHQSDEPDLGASLTMIVPDSLMAIGNGRLKQQSKDEANKKAIYRWEVINPINNYNIIPYIGKYETWHEQFQGENGNLDCDYWVLDYNVEKAKKQFAQAPKMLKCFEYWFGPYPFYEDGYKLVESPHLGMEHQSAVAYGNRFQNGYRGRDLSGTGWGTKWDFIIVHESGHEWFGNNITSTDIGDMWVHEGFTNYSETLFTTCEFGVEAGNDYCIGTRKLIQNDAPIIGPYGVNTEGSGDMYYKGGNLLHTIRQVINNDEEFRKILRGLNSEFRHKTVTSRQVEDYISKQSRKNFSKVFDQYLRTTQIPVLEYHIEGNKLQFRWTNCVTDFILPLKVMIGGKEVMIRPMTKWSTYTSPVAIDKIEINRNFYINSKQVNKVAAAPEKKLTSLQAVVTKKAS
jgi:aminopeptidase N